jgi:ubiquinone/menaquinone biosynthesis C-methylase UbiE
MTEEFATFFRGYSQYVDQADQLAFWQLSDRIIEETLRRNLPNDLPAGACVLDAGGGTGRWIVKLAKHLPCRFLLYDRSDDMLKKAALNVEAAHLRSRVELRQGNLTDMSDIENQSIDHAISIYNVLSFIDDPSSALRELFRVLKPAGTIQIMAQGLYNGLCSKIVNYQASSDELLSIDTNHTIKWAEHVPTLRLFSKETLEGLLSSAGFSIVATHGVPVFVQPGLEDFDPPNAQRSRISEALARDARFFNQVLRLELEYSALPTVANRGMNLLSVARKP